MGPVKTRVVRPASAYQLMLVAPVAEACSVGAAALIQTFTGDVAAGADAKLITTSSVEG